MWRPLFVCLLLAAAALSACQGSSAPEVANASAGDRSSGGNPPAADRLKKEQLGFLKFATVTPMTGYDLADLSGTIEFDEEHSARLGAPAAGRVTEVLVRVGDEVHADQPLLAIESPEVKTAQAGFVRAQSDLFLARRTWERAQRLRAVGAVAEKDFLQAKEDEQKATADFAQARAALERLRVRSEEPGSRYLVYAPIAGTVVERKATVGMQVGADNADPLIVISDLSRVRALVRLPQRQLSLVRPGQEAVVRVDAYEHTFPGQVVAVGDVVEDATQTILVRCSVPNPQRLLKPEMFARVTLKAPDDPHLVGVPAAALLSNGTGFHVLVHRPDGSLEERPVEAGAELNGQVQILSGLRPGEEVVTEGALFAARALATS